MVLVIINNNCEHVIKSTYKCNACSIELGVAVNMKI